MSSRPDRALELAALPDGQAASRALLRGPTIEVARSLLGAWLLRRVAHRLYGARIVEVEAYLGVEDPAAHSYGGRRTARVEPMYADGGHLYVFLVYGMHCCANVVTRGRDRPEAVLLRAAEPPGGDDGRLLSGPGKLCRALAIARGHSGLDLLEDSRFGLVLAPVDPARIGTSTRIGVDYAGEAAGWPLRFYVRGSPALSGPRALSAG
jgi:DNA-3-methyladenine glycosylase